MSRPLSKVEREAMEASTNHLRWRDMCERMLQGGGTFTHADGVSLCQVIIRHADKLERYKETVTALESALTESRARVEGLERDWEALVVAVRDCLGCIGVGGYIPQFGKQRTDRLWELADSAVLPGDAALRTPQKESGNGE